MSRRFSLLGDGVINGDTTNTLTGEYGSNGAVMDTLSDLVVINKDVTNTSSGDSWISNCAEYGSEQDTEMKMKLSLPDIVKKHLESQKFTEEVFLLDTIMRMNYALSENREREFTEENKKNMIYDDFHVYDLFRLYPPIGNYGTKQFRRNYLHFMLYNMWKYKMFKLNQIEKIDNVHHFNSHALCDHLGRKEISASLSEFPRSEDVSFTSFRHESEAVSVSHIKHIDFKEYLKATLTPTHKYKQDSFASKKDVLEYIQHVYLYWKSVNFDPKILKKFFMCDYFEQVLFPYFDIFDEGYVNSGNYIGYIGPSYQQKKCTHSLMYTYHLLSIVIYFCYVTETQGKNNITFSYFRNEKKTYEKWWEFENFNFGAARRALENVKNETQEFIGLKMRIVIANVLLLLNTNFGFGRHLPLVLLARGRRNRSKNKKRKKEKEEKKKKKKKKKEEEEEKEEKEEKKKKKEEEEEMKQKIMKTQKKRVTKKVHIIRKKENDEETKTYKKALKTGDNMINKRKKKKKTKKIEERQELQNVKVTNNRRSLSSAYNNVKKKRLKYNKNQLIKNYLFMYKNNKSRNKRVDWRNFLCESKQLYHMNFIEMTFGIQFITNVLWNSNDDMYRNVCKRLFDPILFTHVNYMNLMNYVTDDILDFKKDVWKQYKRFKKKFSKYRDFYIYEMLGNTQYCDADFRKQEDTAASYDCKELASMLKLKEILRVLTHKLEINCYFFFYYTIHFFQLVLTQLEEESKLKENDVFSSHFCYAENEWQNYVNNKCVKILNEKDLRFTDLHQIMNKSYWLHNNISPLLYKTDENVYYSESKYNSTRKTCKRDPQKLEERYESTPEHEKKLKFCNTYFNLFRRNDTERNHVEMGIMQKDKNWKSTIDCLYHNKCSKWCLRHRATTNYMFERAPGIQSKVELLIYYLEKFGIGRTHEEKILVHRILHDHFLLNKRKMSSYSIPIIKKWKPSFKSPTCYKRTLSSDLFMSVKLSKRRKSCKLWKSSKKLKLSKKCMVSMGSQSTGSKSCEEEHNIPKKKMLCMFLADYYKENRDSVESKVQFVYKCLEFFIDCLSTPAYRRVAYILIEHFNILNYCEISILNKRTKFQQYVKILQYYVSMPYKPSTNKQEVSYLSKQADVCASRHYNVMYLLETMLANDKEKKHLLQMYRQGSPKKSAFWYILNCLNVSLLKKLCKQMRFIPYSLDDEKKMFKSKPKSFSLKKKDYILNNEKYSTLNLFKTVPSLTHPLKKKKINNEKDSTLQEKKGSYIAGRTKNTKKKNKRTILLYRNPLPAQAGNIKKKKMLIADYDKYWIKPPLIEECRNLCRNTLYEKMLVPTEKKKCFYIYLLLNKIFPSEAPHKTMTSMSNLPTEKDLFKNKALDEKTQFHFLKTSMFCCVPLFKINLGFLNYMDYLCRIYMLYRQFSFFELKEHILLAVFRANPFNNRLENVENVLFNLFDAQFQCKITTEKEKLLSDEIDSTDAEKKTEKNSGMFSLEHFLYFKKISSNFFFKTGTNMLLLLNSVPELFNPNTLYTYTKQIVELVENDSSLYGNILWNPSTFERSTERTCGTHDVPKVQIKDLSVNEKYWEELVNIVCAKENTCFRTVGKDFALINKINIWQQELDASQNTVNAFITVDISSIKRKEEKMQWTQLRKGDMVVLVNVRNHTLEYEHVFNKVDHDTFSKLLGIQYVRCAIVEQYISDHFSDVEIKKKLNELDQSKYNSTIINDAVSSFSKKESNETKEIKITETKNTVGNQVVFLVRLDYNMYRRDVMQNEFFYDNFNCIIKIPLTKGYFLNALNNLQQAIRNAHICHIDLLTLHTTIGLPSLGVKYYGIFSTEKGSMVRREMRKKRNRNMNTKKDGSKNKQENTNVSNSNVIQDTITTEDVLKQKIEVKTSSTQKKIAYVKDLPVYSSIRNRTNLSTLQLQQEMYRRWCLRAGFVYNEDEYLQMMNGMVYANVYKNLRHLLKTTNACYTCMHFKHTLRIKNKTHIRRLLDTRVHSLTLSYVPITCRVRKRSVKPNVAKGNILKSLFHQYVYHKKNSPMEEELFEMGLNHVKMAYVFHDFILFLWKQSKDDDNESVIIAVPNFYTKVRSINKRNTIDKRKRNCKSADNDQEKCDSEHVRTFNVEKTRTMHLTTPRMKLIQSQMEASLFCTDTVLNNDNGWCELLEKTRDKTENATLNNVPFPFNIVSNTEKSQEKKKEEEKIYFSSTLGDINNENNLKSVEKKYLSNSKVHGKNFSLRSKKASDVILCIKEKAHIKKLWHANMNYIMPFLRARNKVYRMYSEFYDGPLYPLEGLYLYNPSFITSCRSSFKKNSTSAQSTFTDKVPMDGSSIKRKDSSIANTTMDNGEHRKNEKSDVETTGNGSCHISNDNIGDVVERISAQPNEKSDTENRCLQTYNNDSNAKLRKNWKVNRCNVLGTNSKPGSLCCTREPDGNTHEKTMKRATSEMKMEKPFVTYTAKQMECIKSCLNDSVTLIEGIPGSGKTTVIKKVISIVYENNPKDRVLICARNKHCINDLMVKLVEEMGINKSHIYCPGIDKLFEKETENLKEATDENFVTDVPNISKTNIQRRVMNDHLHSHTNNVSVPVFIPEEKLNNRIYITGLVKGPAVLFTMDDYVRMNLDNTLNTISAVNVGLNMLSYFENMNCAINVENLHFLFRRLIMPKLERYFNHLKKAHLLSTPVSIFEFCKSAYFEAEEVYNMYLMPLDVLEDSKNIGNTKDFMISSATFYSRDYGRNKICTLYLEEKDQGRFCFVDPYIQYNVYHISVERILYPFKRFHMYDIGWEYSGKNINMESERSTIAEHILKKIEKYMTACFDKTVYESIMTPTKISNQFEKLRKENTSIFVGKEDTCSVFTTEEMLQYVMIMANEYFTYFHYGRVFQNKYFENVCRLVKEFAPLKQNIHYIKNDKWICWKIAEVLNLFLKGKDVCDRKNVNRYDYKCLIEQYASTRIVGITASDICQNRNILTNYLRSFTYVIMEDCSQIMECETALLVFIENALYLKGSMRRLILTGDSQQLGPVINNISLRYGSNLEQSLFKRFLRLQVPSVYLNRQGRMRTELCNITRYYYINTNSSINARPLKSVRNNIDFGRSNNPGFKYTHQFINVDGEEMQTEAYYFINLKEVEYVVGLFQYMRSLGYPNEVITILTPYKGQKDAICQALQKINADRRFLGYPATVATVDDYQGRENDYVIVSLVRTQSVGYLKEKNRIIVTFSRARLGLYVVGKYKLYRKEVAFLPALTFLTKPELELQKTHGELYASL